MKKALIYFCILAFFFGAIISTAFGVQKAKYAYAQERAAPYRAGRLFERHRLETGNYSILVEKSTSVCYLECGEEGLNNYSITIMLNPDGTPRLWDPADYNLESEVE